MAALGDQDSVQAILRGSPSITLNADFAAKFSAAQRLVTTYFEQAIGRPFGDGAAIVSDRIVYAGGSTTLLLPIPARSITGIQWLGVWDGAAYIGGSSLAAGDWIADPVDRFGNILGIRNYFGQLWGISDRFGRPVSPLLVSGIWSDDSAEDGSSIPADITEAANYCIAERYKAMTASPAGFVGPDGTVVPIRNPFNDPAVKQVIAKYQTINTLAF